jgi:hypothetical protein
MQVFFGNGSATRRVQVDDLIRHGKRRAEGLPVLENEVPGIDRWALLGKAVRGH